MTISWHGQGASADPATAWTDLCQDITVISLLDDTDPAAARLSSSNPGEIRYDYPGSMHPLLMASVMFCCDAQSSDAVSYLRSHSRRLFLVTD
jgi:hypothetical protein